MHISMTYQVILTAKLFLPVLSEVISVERDRLVQNVVKKT